MVNINLATYTDPNSLIETQDLLSRYFNFFFDDGCVVQTEFDSFLLLSNPTQLDFSFLKEFKSAKLSISSSSKCFLSPFYREYDLQFCQYSHGLTINRADLTNLLKGFINHAQKTLPNIQDNTLNTNQSITWTQPGFIEFEKSFTQIKSWFAQYGTQKAVPTIYEYSTWIPNSYFTRAQLLLNSIENSAQHQKVYGVFHEGRLNTTNHPKFGMIGSTPEILFELKNGNLKTVAIAGTLKKSPTTQKDDLLKSQKDLHEHHCVVQFITNKLSRFGAVSTKGPYVVELPTLYHLKTDINIDHVDIEPLNLINLLHPTPALGMLSSFQNWTDLSRLPFQKDRQYYGTPLTIQIDENHFLSLVCIRNLEWNKTGSYISSGCGIVWESQLIAEWDELELKRESVKKMLGFYNSTEQNISSNTNPKFNENGIELNL